MNALLAAIALWSVGADPSGLKTAFEQADEVTVLCSLLSSGRGVKLYIRTVKADKLQDLAKLVGRSAGRQADRVGSLLIRMQAALARQR